MANVVLDGLPIWAYRRIQSRRSSMNAKAAILVATLGIIPPAYAGGFLSDVLNQATPGAGTSLDSARKGLGDAVNTPLVPGSGGYNKDITAQSNTCVTPRGICPLTQTLKGTVCFCSYGSETVYGRIQ
jgi:hypothetical protein